MANVTTPAISGLGMTAFDVDVVTYVTTDPTILSWVSTNGHLITLTGTFTYTGGIPDGGSVDVITIDEGNDGTINFQVDYPAAQPIVTTLIGSGTDFINTFLDQPDLMTIETNSVFDRYFGDARSTGSGAFTGHDDNVTLTGVDYASFVGDVVLVSFGATSVVGGDDNISITLGKRDAQLFGDFYDVDVSATGGNDTITDLNTTQINTIVTNRLFVGDAYQTDNATGSIIFTGGNDIITGITNPGQPFASFQYKLYGDVQVVGKVNSVTGGNDLLTGADNINGDVISGDFGEITSLHTGALVGGDDEIWGNGGDDFLYGEYEVNNAAGPLNLTGGDDTINGGAGNDTIFGQTGNDTINGGEDDDTMDGGDGFDTLSFVGGAAVVVAMGRAGGTGTATGQGSDIISNFEAVIGSDFDDTITGSDGDDTLDGGEGNDTLAFDASVNGVIVQLRAPGVAGSSTGDGNDVIVNFENAIGTFGEDQILGSKLDNVIEGGDDGDFLRGGAGSDTLSYTSSDAGVTFDFNSNTVSGGHADNDDVAGFENFLGSDHDDSVTTNGADNHIRMGLGNDTVFGSTGNDHYDGGRGTSSANGGSDTLDLTNYSDPAGLIISVGEWDFSGTQVLGTITGTGANHTFTDFEVIIGSQMGDTFISSGWEIGGGFSYQMFGGQGDDVFIASDGIDRMDGGAGVDTVDYSGSDAGVTVNLSAASGGYGDGDDLDDIENLIGSDHEDDFTGGVEDNNYQGGFGNDTLNGGGGNDTINGNQGNDTIDGGEGNDILDGGEGQGQDTIYGGDDDDQIDGRNGVDFLYGDDGNDTINGQNKNDVLEGGAGDDILNGNKGNDTILGGADNDTINGGASADTVSGDDGDDEVYGGGQADLVYGGAGNDLVDGGSGNDFVSGGSGNDTVIGGNGTDVMEGNRDDDLLIGGEGNDVMTGGDGFDVFQFDAAHTGDDTILDFTEDLDMLEFTGGITAGDITIASAGAGGTSTLITVNGFAMTIWLDGVDFTTITTGDDMVFS